MAAKVVNIQVGPVTVRTKIEPALDTESHDRFTVCTGEPEGSHPPARTRQTNACTACDIAHSSAFGFSQRGVERGDQIVVLSKDELAAAKGTPRTGKTAPIEVKFHSREKLYAATVAGDSVQNVMPDKGFEKPYLVLREALAAHPDIVAAMVWAPSSANALWALEVVGDRLVATKRAWPEYVRAVPAVTPVPYLDAEVELMAQFVSLAVEDFDLSVYSDESKRNLDDLVASKTGVSVAMAPVQQPGIPDLLASLQQSIATATKAKAPAKKTAAKRAPAKKTAARKAPAGKVA